MAYGIVKVDQITFTNDGTDQTISVSGIVQSISGNITATGTIQGTTIIGTSTVSGATVTGNAGVFTTVTGGSAGFTTVTGTTVTGTTADFVSGVFTTQISGATITGDTFNATSITGISGVFTTQISGATVTGNTGSFTTLTGGVATITSGVFAYSSGRLLVGTSSARNIQTHNAKFQLEGIGYNNSTLQIFGNQNNAEGAYLFLGKSRGTTLASNAIVQANDELGTIDFYGTDGVTTLRAARIGVYVDGTPGVDDMPGRLVFSVTADGAKFPTTSPSAMTINSGQEVLIGYSTDNGAYKLQVNSQIFATSATIATSDGRYKENVATLDGCVDLVKALRPVSFDWKAQQPITRVDEDGETVVVREAHNFPDGKQVGFIAQEVEKVLADKPWLGSVIKQNVRPAVTDNDGNELAPEEEFLGIAEGNLVAVLTSALKDAIGRIESLEAEVAALKA